MAICLVNDPTSDPPCWPRSTLTLTSTPGPQRCRLFSGTCATGRVRGVYSIGDAEAEVIEAQVLGTSEISGKLVRDIDFPEGALLGAVLRGELFMPKGSSRIEEGDVITVFSLSSDIPEVERLLQVSVDFF